MHQPRTDSDYMHPRDDRHPACDSSILPFWFWNGAMRDDEIVRQIGLMAAQGVDGFFIASRQGLEVPYLSDTWFQKVRLACEAAARSKLQVWLYDEYPYPSGMAGGAVAFLHPEARHCTLRPVRGRASGAERIRLGLGQGKVLLARAYRRDARHMGDSMGDAGQGAGDTCAATEQIDLERYIGILHSRPVFQRTGLTAYNDKRFFTAEPAYILDWVAPAGEWELLVIVESEIRDFKYYGYYMDPCHAGAVQSFIDVTYERYAQEVGDLFGTTIRGFFSDETGFLGNIPWSRSLEEVFAKRNGYALLPHLDLLLQSGAAGAPRFRYDYFQTLHELLRERYHAPIRRWCDAKGLAYIAETPSMRATTQLHASMPASDSGHEKFGRPISTINRKNARSLRYNPKMASSLGSQRGVRDILVECFHSVGWSMTLQDVKWMIDRFLALGTNCFNFHAFFYDTDGLKKHDAPPSQFFQNPYWPDFHLLSAYAKRASALLRQGRACCPIAVLDPVTSLWTHLGNPMHEFAYAGECPREGARLKRLVDDWTALTSGLLEAGRDYQHLDPEMLAKAQIGNGTIALGDSVYRILILPPLANLETKAWQAVQRFLQSGGTVIATGLLPFEDIGEGADLPEQMCSLFGIGAVCAGRYWAGETMPPQDADRHAGAFWCPADRSAPESDWVRRILAIADSRCPPAVLWDCGANDGGVFVHTRFATESVVRIFVANQNASPRSGTLLLNQHELGLRGTGLSVSALNLESGERRAVAVAQQGCGLFEVVLALCAGESVLLEVTVGKESAASVCGIGSAERIVIPTDGLWRVRTDAPNLLRIDDFDLQIDGVHVGKAAAAPFIDQCAQLQPALRLRYRQEFGCPVVTQIAFPLAVTLRSFWTVRAVPPTCRILTESGTVQGEFEVSLNGTVVSLDATGSADIAALLRTGVNELCFCGHIASAEEGICGPLWLAGEFGVELPQKELPTIVKAPPQIPFPVGAAEGYPYFAGTLILEKSINGAPAAHAAERFECELQHEPVAFGQSAALVINGVDLGTRAWEPYCWKGGGGILREDQNVLELRIRTGLEGKFEGRFFDAQTHSMQPLAKHSEKGAD